MSNPSAKSRLWNRSLLDRELDFEIEVPFQIEELPPDQRYVITQEREAALY